MASNELTQPHEAAVTRFIRRVLLITATSFALTGATWWLFTWGTAVLALRGATSSTRAMLLWGVAGVVPVALLAVALAMRRAPDRAAVAALLDDRSNCGGLLMAASQAELGEWRSRIPALVQPQLRWRKGRRGGLLMASVAFVVASFIVPVRFGPAQPGRPLDVDKEVEQLAADIETLKKEEIIEQSRMESLQQELDSIKADASGQDPAKTWEALDHLQQTIDNTAQEAAERLAASAQKLAQSQALAEAMTDRSVAMDNKLMTESMKELSELTGQAAADGKLFEDGLSQELLDGLKTGSLTSDQLKQLAAALGQRKGEIAKRLKELRDARLIDLAEFKKCEGAGECDGEGIAAFLAENGDEMSVEEILTAWGKGGIDRGRGDAPMTWSEGTGEQGAKFKEQIIPPSTIAGLKDSQLVGRSIGAPTIEHAGPAGSGALRGAAAGGGSALTHTVLPRHKGAVKRYFER